MTSIPPLPSAALGRGHQYRLAALPGGKQVWILRARFRRKKHKGRAAGAFGGARK